MFCSIHTLLPYVILRQPMKPSRTTSIAISAIINKMIIQSSPWIHHNHSTWCVPLSSPSTWHNPVSSGGMHQHFFADTVNNWPDSATADVDVLLRSTPTLSVLGEWRGKYCLCWYILAGPSQMSQLSWLLQQRWSSLCSAVCVLMITYARGGILLLIRMHPTFQWSYLSFPHQCLALSLSGLNFELIPLLLLSSSHAPFWPISLCR